MEEDTWNKIIDLRVNGSLSHFLSYFSVMELSSPFLKTYPFFLTLKEGSTSHLGLLLSGKKRETALLGAQSRYTLRLAGHQSPRHILRDGTAWDASGNIFYVLDFGGVSEKSGVFRHIDVYK